MGHLRLQLASDGDGTGELFVAFEANGFSGHGSAWFDVANLAEAATQFAKYPLPKNPLVCIAGGNWSDKLPLALVEEHLHISAYPTNARGGICLRVKTIYTLTGDGQRESKYFASAELRSSYEQLRHFSNALIALTRGETEEVVLDEKDV